jgi:hypothetical protein
MFYLASPFQEQQIICSNSDGYCNVFFNFIHWKAVEISNTIPIFMSKWSKCRKDLLDTNTFPKKCPQSKLTNIILIESDRSTALSDLQVESKAAWLSILLDKLQSQASSNPILCEQPKLNLLIWFEAWNLVNLTYFCWFFLWNFHRKRRRNGGYLFEGGKFERRTGIFGFDNKH